MTGSAGARTLRRVAATGVKTLAAAGDAVRDRRGITILIYHRVGAGSGGQMDLTPTDFDDQLRWLVRTTEVLTLDGAADRLRTAAPAAEGSADGAGGVVLTFDDGTTDWVDHVLPSLERYGVPATFYVATDFVERGLPFPADGRPITWSGLAELASSPLVTIGSHTHRHLLLDRLAPDEVADELDRSIDLLGDHLGRAPEHFAYPKAVAGSPAAESAVRERFRTAVLAGTRPNRPGADLHRLHRSPVQAADGYVWFRRKARGGLALEDDLRRAANRVRYRGLSA